MKNENLKNIVYLEPISSTPPKLSSIDTRPIVAKGGGAFSILCPAQGFPSPSFR
jgi:hypothetical protein